MKRLITMLLLFAMSFSIIGCNDTSKSESEQEFTRPHTSTSEPTTESNVCVNHDFSEATFISPRKCKICEETEGEPLCLQCETWEEVVALTGFDEYAYDLQVMGTEDHIILYITINDDGLFATEVSTNNFMLSSFTAFQCISWFSQNRLDVTTPEMFQVDTTIRLVFTGGSLTCMPIENRYRTGYSTMLNCDADSPNKSMIESAYNMFFSLTSI